MEAPSPDSYSGLCVVCGDFATLNEVTGFCGPCSQGRTASTTTSFSFTTSKTELALQANANAIEHYIGNGSANTTWQALSLARQNRAICIVCGEPIPRAPRNAVFCRRNKECRRFSRRYVYLYAEKKLSKTEALAQIFSELS